MSCDITGFWRATGPANDSLTCSIVRELMPFHKGFERSFRQISNRNLEHQKAPDELRESAQDGQNLLHRCTVGGPGAGEGAERCP